MKTQSQLAIGLGLALLVASGPARADNEGEKNDRHHDQDERAQIEPNAGNWRTWVIS